MPRALSEAEAIATLRAALLEPLEPYRNSETPWPCRCMRCGNPVSPRLHNIRNGWGGCDPCGVKDMVATKREHEAVRAEADMRANGLEPLVPFTHTKTPWKSMCMKCGRTVTPRLNNVRSGHLGCVHCGGKAPVDPAVAAADVREIGLEPLEPYTTALDAVAMPLSSLRPRGYRPPWTGSDSERGVPLLRQGRILTPRHRRALPHHA